MGDIMPKTSTPLLGELECSPSCSFFVVAHIGKMAQVFFFKHVFIFPSLALYKYPAGSFFVRHARKRALLMWRVSRELLYCRDLS